MRQAKKKKDETLNWMDSNLFSVPEKIAMEATPYVCPVCVGHQMMALEYDDTGVVVEYCVSCQGLWLNKGEFNKIIDILHRRSIEQPVGAYVKSAAKEVKEVLHGPEPLLEELKDLRMVVRLLQCRICSHQPKFSHHAAESLIASVGDPDEIEGVKSVLGG